MFSYFASLSNKISSNTKHRVLWVEVTFMIVHISYSLSIRNIEYFAWKTIRIVVLHTYRRNHCFIAACFNAQWASVKWVRERNGNYAQFFKPSCCGYVVLRLVDLKLVLIFFTMFHRSGRWIMFFIFFPFLFLLSFKKCKTADEERREE